MIQGLKKPENYLPIFTDNEAHYFAGNETKVHCDTITFNSRPEKAIAIQDLLESAQVKEHYNHQEDLLIHPKQSHLQHEPFRNHIAVNRFGIDHRQLLSVANGFFSTMPKFQAFVKNDTVENAKLAPKISNVNILKNPQKISTSFYQQSSTKQGKVNTKQSHFKNHQRVFNASNPRFKGDKRPHIKMSKKVYKQKMKLAVDQVVKDNKTPNQTLNKRYLKDRLQTTAETIATMTKQGKVDTKQSHFKNHQRVFNASNPRFKGDKRPHIKMSKKVYKQKMKLAVDQVVKDNKTPNQTMNKRYLKDRLQTTVETIATMIKQPKAYVHLDRYLKENRDIMKGVVVLMKETRPNLALNVAKYLKNKTIFSKTFDQTLGKQQAKIVKKHKEKKCNNLLQTSYLSSDFTVEPDSDPVTPCLLDDRYLSRDQLPTMECGGSVPLVGDLHLPAGFQFRK